MLWKSCLRASPAKREGEDSEPEAAGTSRIHYREAAHSGRMLELRASYPPKTLKNALRRAKSEISYGAMSRWVRGSRSPPTVTLSRPRDDSPVFELNARGETCHSDQDS